MAAMVIESRWELYTLLLESPSFLVILEASMDVDQKREAPLLRPYSSLLQNQRGKGRHLV